MEHLPWVVVHGQWVWVLALVALVALAVAWAAWRRRGAPGRARRLVTAALAGGLVWLAVFGGGAAALRDQTLSPLFERSSLAPAAIDDRLALMLAAAATPFHRDDALEQLARNYAHSGAPSRELGERIFGVYELLGRCEPALLFAVEHGFFAEALARWPGCDDRQAQRLRAQAAMWLGELDAASELYAARRRDPDLRDLDAAIVAHLLAGESDLAAQTIRHGLATDQVPRPRRPALSCLADALAARGGYEAAGELLILKADGDPWCRVLLADLAAPEARRALLEPLVGSVDSGVATAAYLLWAEAALATGHPEELPRAEGVVASWVRVGPTAGSLAGHPGLERPLAAAVAGVAEPSDAIRALRAALALQEAKRAYLTGDPALMTQARAALADFEALGAEPGARSVHALLALAHLQAGDAAEARAAAAAGRSPDLERLAEELEVGLPGVREGQLLRDLPQEVLTAVVERGDGDALADWLESDVHTHREILDAAVHLAPLVKTGGDRVLGHVLHGRFGMPPLDTADRVGVIARRGLAAAALGASEAAAAEGEAVRRTLEAMSRREVAVPLMVLALH